jgi:preprotein translocase subunit SecA
VRDLQLQILDLQWKAHLHTMDALRESINLRGYAQRDPKIEYQREGFELFGEMEQRIDDSFAEYVFKFGYPRPNLQPKATARRVDGGSPVAAQAASSPAAAAGARAGSAGASSDGAATVKVGRNDPCPCGSGKKHKKCCGA